MPIVPAGGDRLVPGQVVVVWGRPLDLHRIVLVDDDVRQSPWEQELYRMAAPAEIAMDFVSAAEAARICEGWTPCRERVLVLVGTIGTAGGAAARAPGALSLGSTWVAPRRPGRRERLAPTCSVGRGARDAAQRMAERGVE